MTVKLNIYAQSFEINALREIIILHSARVIIFTKDSANDELLWIRSYHLFHAI